jgi:hypothetical protein
LYNEKGQLELYQKNIKIGFTTESLLFWHEMGHTVYDSPSLSYIAINIENHARNILGYSSRPYDANHSPPFSSFFFYYYNTVIKNRP